jgi:hypothetical protein
MEFNHGDADFGEEMRYMTNFDNVFPTQTLKPP